MPRRLPPLNALRAFEAAGRHGSFTGAAEELHVSHAAVSRHVRGLEKRIGVELFRVAARGVELTETGRTYLAAITPALDQIAKATEAVAGTVAGRVTVSCEPIFAIRWLGARIGHFEERHRGIEVVIDASPVVVNLHRHECDMAIRFSRRTYEGLAADLICPAPVIPVGAPDLYATLPADAPASALLNLRLLHEDDGQLWRDWFAAAGLADVDLPRSGRASSLITMEAALAGSGVALVSEALVAEDIRTGRLVRFSDVSHDFGDYVLLYLPDRINAAAVAAFRTWLLEESLPLREG